MSFDNPTRILRTLDAHLGHVVELTLIGKSALWLGYDNPPIGYGVTQDVDAVVPIQQSDQMNEDLPFWEALRSANRELENTGIYLTHIFEECQVILRKDWFLQRVAIERPDLVHIRLYRPATLDLILSKMMRGADPHHMEEIRWLILREKISRYELEAAFSAARVPDEKEIHDSFDTAKPLVLSMATTSL